MNKDLTVGKPSTVLWKFCLPLFGSVIFQQLYNIADSFVAGKFVGENALAAVGNSYEITLIFIAFGFGCNMGCSVIVSRLFGAKQYKDLKTAVYTTWIASGVLCAVLMIAGLLLGSITIPLTGDGYNGPCFSLGTTGGVLIMCLVFGHFGHIGKLSLEVKEGTLKVMKEFGLALFLLGAGVHGGVALVEQVAANGGVAIVLWGFFGGLLMTVAPLIVGYFIGRYLLKLPLLNNLGSITGGMTSTPALGTLISTAKTNDVASAYASTYPISLVLVVLASQLMITLM